MKVLVLGQGGREHAIVHRLSQSPSVSEVHVAPGNDGMRPLALCHPWTWKDTDKIIEFCLRSEIELVVIGPEDPLVNGLADQLRERGLLVVGPSQEGARLEGSKIFAKEFMSEAGIPTAKYQVVTDLAGTLSAAKFFTPPYVLKADGLCAGKGVYICKDEDELKKAAEDLFERKIFGKSGERALLEQFHAGWELSYLFLTNGESAMALPIAQDHKRLMDGDLGPNTGGMGTWAPLNVDPLLRQQIETQIVQPTIKILQKRGILYRGFVFLGVMVTPEGPLLLEYNCRLGDPETQVILPLIQNDFGHVLRSLSLGRLLPLQTRNMSAACVVLAAPGYPENPVKGIPIEGDLNNSTSSSYFLVAGAAQESSGKFVTNGGRVLCSLGVGNDLKEALEQSYRQASQVKFKGLQMRSDIGAKAVPK